jgi:uncharacterized lipoprotein YmbA
MKPKITLLLTLLLTACTSSPRTHANIYTLALELAVRMEKSIEEIGQRLINNIDQDSSWVVPL